MADTMDNSLDKTTIETVHLLEARLARLEHIAYGPAGAPDAAPRPSAASTMYDLERRFQSLVSKSRVYQDILRIYNQYPTLFTAEPQYSQAADSEHTLPTQLDTTAAGAIVLSSASRYPATASALVAVTQDVPVPDPALSASLIATEPRARGLEATQLAQAAEVAELRARSERLVRAWYEGRLLKYGRFVADAEARVEEAEKTVLRAEARRTQATKP